MRRLALLVTALSGDSDVFHPEYRSKEYVVYVVRHAGVGTAGRGVRGVDGDGGGGGLRL